MLWVGGWVNGRKIRRSKQETRPKEEEMPPSLFVSLSLSVFTFFLGFVCPSPLLLSPKTPSLLPSFPPPSSPPTHR